MLMFMLPNGTEDGIASISRPHRTVLAGIGFTRNHVRAHPASTRQIEADAAGPARTVSDVAAIQPIARSTLAE